MALNCVRLDQPPAGNPSAQGALVILTTCNQRNFATRTGVGLRVDELYQGEGRSDYVCEDAKVHFISLTRRGLKGQITAFIAEVVSVLQVPERGNKERKRLGLEPRQNENRRPGKANCAAS